MKGLRKFILPQTVDFFKRLETQSILCRDIIDELRNIYLSHKSSSFNLLKKMIKEAEQARRKNLKELEQVFITPVDKEAISRAYINLDWVVMSIKHLQAELEIYGVEDLKEYTVILDLLREEMSDITNGFGMLHENKDGKSAELMFEIIHYDNELIKEYARQVSKLLESNDIKKIITQKEILYQLKEISKRIRLCANDLGDMLFKMT